MSDRQCPQCNTVVVKDAIYCPECGVNMKQYVKDNAKELLFKKPEKEDNGLGEKPEIKTSTIIFLILLTILIVPVGLIAAVFVYWNHKKEVEEWQRDKIIMQTS